MLWKFIFSGSNGWDPQILYDNTDSNQYYDGPCGMTGSGDDNPCNSVPICDESTCTTSCINYMHYKRGMCIENECYCQKESEPTKPTVDEDWNHADQSGIMTIT